MIVSVYDEKLSVMDPKVGSSTLNIEPLVTSLNNSGKWKCVRTELLHKDGLSSGILNLELRYVAKNGIIQKRENDVVDDKNKTTTIYICNRTTQV